MPVPKKKVSKSRRNMRRAHHALVALQFVSCPSCTKPRLAHCVCESCGFYRGRFIPKHFLNTAPSSVIN